MKQSAKLILMALAITATVSCKRYKENTPTISETYTSIDDFRTKNDAVLQNHTINASTGGSFTTPQGTVVTIPANAFVTSSNIPVTGQVTIEFKDIYKKSDMVLSGLTTVTIDGKPLKSGGEFYINVLLNNTPIQLAAGKSISVEQPGALSGGIDTENIMQPYIAVESTDTTNLLLWTPVSKDTSTSKTPISVSYNRSDNYQVMINKLYTSTGSGTWINSDNDTYFNQYTETTLTGQSLNADQSLENEFYLVFKNINTVVRVWHLNDEKQYYDQYAPVGLECTLVVFGTKEGELYATFQPLTITENKVVSYTLNKMTTEEFKTQLTALDN